MEKYKMVTSKNGQYYGLVELSKKDYNQMILSGAGMFRPDVPDRFKNRNCIFEKISQFEFESFKECLSDTPITFTTNKSTINTDSYLDMPKPSEDIELDF